MAGTALLPICGGTAARLLPHRWMRTLCERSDMVELYESLKGPAAVWVGHDWGSLVAASIAAQHPEICRGAVRISVPYFPQGFALSSLVPLVDRQLYPLDEYPDGQWDYF